MDFNKLKEVAKKLGGILVMSGDEPDFVILDYKNYEALIKGGSAQSIDPSPVSSSFTDSQPEPRLVGDSAPVSPTQPSSVTQEDPVLIENLNKEIQALNEEIKQSESDSESDKTDPPAPIEI